MCQQVAACLRAEDFVGRPGGARQHQGLSFYLGLLMCRQVAACLRAEDFVDGWEALRSIKGCNPDSFLLMCRQVAACLRAEDFVDGREALRSIERVDSLCIRLHRLAPIAKPGAAEAAAPGGQAEADEGACISIGELLKLPHEVCLLVVKDRHAPDNAPPRLSDLLLSRAQASACLD